MNALFQKFYNLQVHKIPNSIIQFQMVEHPICVSPFTLRLKAIASSNNKATSMSLKLSGIYRSY